MKSYSGNPVSITRERASLIQLGYRSLGLIECGENDCAAADFARGCQGSSRHLRDAQRQFLTRRFNNNGIPENDNPFRQVLVLLSSGGIERSVPQPCIGLGFGHDCLRQYSEANDGNQGRERRKANCLDKSSGFPSAQESQGPE